MDDQPKRELEGATASAEAAPKADAGSNRIERRAMNAEARRIEARLNAKAKEISEVQSLRAIAVQINDTAKAAVGLLKEVLDGKILAGRVDANGKAVLVLWVDPGKDLTDDLCDQLVKMFGMPVVTLTKGLSFEAIPAEALEKAGWVRRLAAVDPQAGIGP